ncbi:DUF47 domain-containing protein [Cellulosimicrobium cellulans]|uniref:DUF47 domain-containing protein n=1 Tax=Cellulosimicrobium cellulans TaxID=1710 RepID=UPI00381E72AC
MTAQVEAAREGARLASALTRKEISTTDARARIADVERRGDEMRAALVDQLSRSLSSPLDREDLFRISRMVDDVLDALREFVREADLYKIEQRRSYEPMVASIVDSLARLDSAVQALWRRPREVPERALRAKKAASKVSRAYQAEFVRILRGPVTAQSLKQRELIKRLDAVARHIHDAADALTEGVVKRGY